eukprot:463556-Ditylum_brightwellii.AAC.1
MLVSHLKFSGTVCKEGNVHAIWFGHAKNSNRSWALDQEYLLDKDSSYVWSVDFLDKFHNNWKVWTQVEPGNTATKSHLLVSSISHVPLAFSNTKLSNRLVPLLSWGNPVITYQQHDLVSVMAYYGDRLAANAMHAASQQTHPINKSKVQVVNDILVKYPHVCIIHRM